MSLKHLSIFIILYSINSTLAEDVILQIPNGRILGRKASTTTNKTYFAFQKIPYAIPPVGHLRFQPPKAAKSWDGILNATQLDVICYQQDHDNDLESEDCLYLNVYTPQLPNGDQSLPVMVWIYGGAFSNGHSSTQLYGPEFLLNEDVIVVTFNYRLGVFGFLSTEDRVIPGNNGLKDQLLAIKWVNKNIEYFGGDPNRVILFGESAGSSSITFHLLNHKTDGLYRGVICESGVALNQWSIQSNARQNAFILANYLNATINFNGDSKLLHDFYINLTASELDQTAEKFSKSLRRNHIRLVFAPVIETVHEQAFITKKIYKSFRDGEFVKVPVILGFNSEEAIHFTGDYDFNKISQLYDENFNFIIPDNIGTDNEVNRRKIGRFIRKIYTDGKFSDNIGAFVRFLSDDTYNRGIIRNAELLSQHTDVYLYQFSYDGVMGNMFLKIDGADNVTHFEEVRYLWRMNQGDYNNANVNQYPQNDILTHRRLLKLWTNFAKALNPTHESIDLLQNLTWSPINNSLAYLDIGENLEMKVNPKNLTYKLWKSIFKKYGHDNFNTY